MIKDTANQKHFAVLFNNVAQIYNHRWVRFDVRTGEKLTVFRRLAFSGSACRPTRRSPAPRSTTPLTCTLAAWTSLEKSSRKTPWPYLEGYVDLNCLSFVCVYSLLTGGDQWLDLAD